MSNTVALLLALVVFAQLPIAIIVYFDARRLGLKQPEKYELGIIVPAAGFIVILYYLSNRRDLPKRGE
ncbi:hypothetical protein [Halorubrum gandharaense]